VDADEVGVEGPLSGIGTEIPEEHVDVEGAIEPEALGYDIRNVLVPLAGRGCDRADRCWQRARRTGGSFRLWCSLGIGRGVRFALGLGRNAGAGACSTAVESVDGGYDGSTTIRVLQLGIGVAQRVRVLDAHCGHEITETVGMKGRKR